MEIKREENFVGRAALEQLRGRFCRGAESFACA
jgi:hypothetical protein